MRIGIAIGLGATTPGEPETAAGWKIIQGELRAAEAVGFDLAIIEDVLLEAASGRRVGFWESVSIAGAVAQATSTIEFGHSMVNAPYRSPALVAKIAATLDEISGGRYILGLGAGNTTDGDYAAFGAPSDHRYSRFAEGVEIIHGLLKDGAVDFDGEYQSARNAELVLRGPRPNGPPIVIAAWGPKMMSLAARFADEWNGFALKPQTVETFRPMIEQLERACAEAGRDPATLRRSLDVYVDATAIVDGVEPSELAPYLIGGTHAGVAEQVLAFSQLGIDEVRCYLLPPLAPDSRSGAIEAMADIVEHVHSG